MLSANKERHKEPATAILLTLPKVDITMLIKNVQRFAKVHYCVSLNQHKHRFLIKTFQVQIP